MCDVFVCSYLPFSECWSLLFHFYLHILITTQALLRSKVVLVIPLAEYECNSRHSARSKLIYRRVVAGFLEGRGSGLFGEVRWLVFGKLLIVFLYWELVASQLCTRDINTTKFIQWVQLTCFLCLAFLPPYPRCCHMYI